MANMTVISSDSHILEPSDLWTTRMDAKKFGGRIPHLVQGDPYDDWTVDGRSVGVIGTAGSAGQRFEHPEEINREGKYDTVRAGGSDAHERMKDLALDGVYADVLYPTFAMAMLGAVPAGDLLRPVFSAYNDWISEFCTTFSDRLKGIAVVLLDDDIEAATAELKRAATLGLSGAMISSFPLPGETYDHPKYEPFWTAAEELDIPLSLPSATNRPAAPPAFEVDSGRFDLAQSGAARVNFEYWIRMSLCHMIYSGLFERHPKLSLVTVEYDLAWLPYFLNRLDITYIERPTQTTHRFEGGALPSDFMGRNVYHSFQEDGLGVFHRDIIGVDRILWRSDYPHAESTFPKSREILDSILEGVPEDEKALIVGGNTARLYKIA